MRSWRVLCALLLTIISLVTASDETFDFDDLPGGGPSTVLRKCATYAYAGFSPAGTIYNLGCKLISCICRPDLVDAAHDEITKAVVANCRPEGQDTTTDVAQAIKIYNDYCSWKGYDIPGYIYIITTTASILAGPTAIANTNFDASGYTTPASAGTFSGLGGGAEPIATVTVRVLQSTASKARASQFLRILYLTLVLPSRYIYAFAETLVVTVAPLMPTPATTSVPTTFMTIDSGPEVSTEVNHDSPTSTERSMTSSQVHSRTSKNATPAPTLDSGPDGTSGQGTESLTKLEVIGIIIAIVTAVITMVLTFWLCVFGSLVRR